MEYSKEELLTIGNFFEIPNVDQKKTARQLKIIIDKWMDKGIERLIQHLLHLKEMERLIQIANQTDKKSIDSEMFNDEFDNKFKQLLKDNMHLPLDLKLEKCYYFFVEKIKQFLSQNYEDEELIQLISPNAAKFSVLFIKEIFYNPNFDAEKFKISMLVEFIRLF